MKEYTEAVSEMQQALRDAVVDSDVLENALNEYAQKRMAEQQAAEEE